MSVWYCGDAPRQAREAIERLAYHSHQQEATGCGQTPLTRFERAQIDFSRTNLFHARACKAIAAEFVVEDWLAHYDHTLTVCEHVKVYRREGRSGRSGPTMCELAGGSS